MKIKRVALLMAGLSVGLVVAALVMTALYPATPAQAQSPVEGAAATLAVATVRAAQVRAAQQATSQAAAVEAARQAAIAQATRAALSAESTRQAQSIQATANAQNAQSTHAAFDELQRRRAATATAEVMHTEATRTAQEATATAAVMNAQATRQAQHATATSQAVMIAAQATDAAQLSATYAERQERFTFGLLLVEIFFVCGAAWVLWKLARTLAAWADRMRPRAEPSLAGLIENITARPVVIDAEPVTPVEPRMPDLVQVVDNPAMVEALDRWAEKFDAERGVSYGN